MNAERTPGLAGASWTAPQLARRCAHAGWRSWRARDRAPAPALAALAVLGAFLLWSVAIQPAWRTLREAPAQLEPLDAQLQQMQRAGRRSRELRATPPLSAEQSAAALKAASDRLGNKARLSLQGDRAVLTLNGVSSDALRDWLAEARAGARARPVEAQLSRGAQGYSGSVVLSLGRRAMTLEHWRELACWSRLGRRRARRAAASPNPRLAQVAWERTRKAVARWALGGPALRRRRRRSWRSRPPPGWPRPWPRATGQRLLLADARGTVWNGSAVPVLTGGPDSRDAAALPGPAAAGRWACAAWGSNCACARPAASATSWCCDLRPGLGRMAVQLHARLGPPSASGRPPGWPAWARRGTRCSSAARCA